MVELCRRRPKLTVGVHPNFWIGVNREIHWGDETELVYTDVRGRIYAPSGKTAATLAIGGTRKKLSMMARVTNQGKTRWMIIDEAFDTEKLIEFLLALIKDASQKVFLIMDNL
jgi:hypothetical protein